MQESQSEDNFRHMGFESADLLLTGNPDFLAKDPEDIIRIIKTINTVNP